MQKYSFCLLLIPILLVGCVQKKIIIHFPNVDSGIIAKSNKQKIEYCVMYEEKDSILLFFGVKNKDRSGLYPLYNSSNRYLRVGKENIPLITDKDILFNWRDQQKGIGVQLPIKYPFYVKIYCSNRDSCIIKK